MPKFKNITRSRLKNTYFQALAFSHVDAILRRLHARRGRALVLNLHRVSPERNAFWAPMTPEAFSSLVDHLAATCEVLTLDQLEARKTSTSPRVVLSFDDGCRDFVEYAMPILARRGLRVNHNVIARSVESGQPPWVIQILDALNVASTRRIQALDVPGFDLRLQGSDELAKTRYGTGLTGYLKALPRVARESVCTDITALIDETNSDAFTPMMSRADVESAAGVHDIGSHSYDHEAMANLSDAEFATDLDRCSQFFGQLGLPMTTYAFPYGSHRPSQIQIARASGIKCVLLVGERPATIGDGVYTRITMYGDSVAELRLRAAGHRLGVPHGYGE
jgi:peptidoglycan/xylan/chitin deacetylase (PgdA/CDA1 family)